MSRPANALGKLKIHDSVYFAPLTLERHHRDQLITTPLLFAVQREEEEEDARYLFLVILR